MFKDGLRAPRQAGLLHAIGGENEVPSCFNKCYALHLCMVLAVVFSSVRIAAAAAQVEIVILKNCSFCLVPNNATACTNCGLGALSDAACLLHFDLCDPGPPDPRPAPDDVDELLDDVANRLDVRIDAGD